MSADPIASLLTGVPVTVFVVFVAWFVIDSIYMERYEIRVCGWIANAIDLVLQCALTVLAVAVGLAVGIGALLVCMYVGSFVLRGFGR